MAALVGATALAAPPLPTPPGALFAGHVAAVGPSPLDKGAVNLGLAELGTVPGGVVLLVRQAAGARMIPGAVHIVTVIIRVAA
jgi:hypothetical protein